MGEVKAMMVALEEKMSRQSQALLRSIRTQLEEERARAEEERARGEEERALRDRTSSMHQGVQSAMAEAVSEAVAQGLRLHENVLLSVRGELSSTNGCNGNNGNVNGDETAASLASLSPSLSLSLSSRKAPPPGTPVINGPCYGPHLDRQMIQLLPYAHVQAALFAQAQTESNQRTSFRPWHEREAHLLCQADLGKCVPMYNTWRTFRGLPVPALPDQDEVELRPFAFVRAGMYLVAAERRLPWYEVAVVEDARVPRVTRESIREALDLLAEHRLDPIGLGLDAFLSCWHQRSRTPTPPLP